MTPRFYCILCRWSSFEVIISGLCPLLTYVIENMYNEYNTILKLRFDILSINPFPFLHFYFHLSTSLSSSFLHFWIVFASFSSFQTSFFLFSVKSFSHLDHHFQWDLCAEFRYQCVGRIHTGTRHNYLHYRILLHILHTLLPVFQ